MTSSTLTHDLPLDRTTGRAPDWDTLRSLVTGRLVTPGEAAWEQARTPWLVNIDQQPAAVLEVAADDDVVHAVRWARAHRWSVTAQPSGHAPRTTLDGTLMLRTRALGGIDIDVERRLATVGAGVKFGELCAALDGTGLMALAGSNADPSVVGLTLGGGVSWFSRLHGFTANSVESVDLVDPDGDLVHVDAQSDPDLFWALRGGGGDFGIVVRIRLRLFDAPELYGGQLLWPVEHAPAVLRAFRDLARVAPRELSLWAHVLHFPPLEEVPEPLRGRSFVNVAATFVGSAQLAEILLWSLRDAAPVEIDLMGPFPPSRLSEVAAEPTDPMPGMEYSALLEDLDDAAIDALAAVVTDPARCPLMMVQIRGLGGAFTDRTPGNGAVRPVGEPFQLFALGVPAVPRAGRWDRARLHGHRRCRGSARQRVPDAQLHRSGAGRRGRLRPGQPGPAPRPQARPRPAGTIRSNKPVLG